jgi:hypothetical protein
MLALLCWVVLLGPNVGLCKWGSSPVSAFGQAFLGAIHDEMQEPELDSAGVDASPSGQCDQEELDIVD